MKLISYLVRTSPGMLALAAVVGVISGACNIGLLAVINAALSGDKYRSAGFVWIFIALCLAVPITRVASEVLLIYLGQTTVFELRLQLSRLILSSPLRELEKLGAHRLLAALTSDVMAIAQALTIIPFLCINFTIVVGSMVYLGLLSWQVLLVMLALMVVGIISYQVPMGKALRAIRLAREDEEVLLKRLRALINGAKELKLNSRRREAFLCDMLRPAATALRSHTITGTSIYVTASNWGQMLFFVLIGFLLFALTIFRDFSTATLTGCALTILFLRSPLVMILDTFPNLGRANVALKKIEDLGLSLEQLAEREPPGSRAEGPVFEVIELAGICHDYHNEEEGSNFILGPIDLSFRPGEMIFLLGGNGSGKTTFAKLLAGLYVPEAGEVRLNNQPVTEESRQNYRELFSAVFYDFYLFEKLIGVDAKDLDARASNYLAQLRLQDKVAVNEGVLTTIDLSQGQRKRLALLTAYLENRPIYIFDEWAADQDSFFKEIFYGELLPDLKARGKTVFVITHDDRYYHIADRIIKLDCGKIDYDTHPAHLKDLLPDVLAPYSAKR